MVKIQKPKAQAQVTADLDIVMRLAARLERSTQWGRTLGVVGMADGFAASLREELDYRVEVDNTQAIARGRPGQRAPDPARVRRVVHQHRAGDRTAVRDAARICGRAAGRLTDRAARASWPTGSSAASCSRSWSAGSSTPICTPATCCSVPTGELQLLDFGSVGRLDDGARDALTMLVLAIDRGSSTAATDALIDLMDPPASRSTSGGWNARSASCWSATAVARRSTGGMFAQLFALVNRWGFGVPPQIAAVFRTLARSRGHAAAARPVAQPGRRAPAGTARQLFAGLDVARLDPRAGRDRAGEPAAGAPPTSAAAGQDHRRPREGPAGRQRPRAAAIRPTATS